MTTHLSGSVGTAGQNRRSDVETVQRLLTKHGVNPGRIDGQCGPVTIRAIIEFQARFTSHPDGRVDSGGKTLIKLNEASTQRQSQPPNLSIGANQTLTARVPRPTRDRINKGLIAVTPNFMFQNLGSPRDSYSVDCQPMTNQTLKRHIVTQSAGRFNVTGLRPAVESLRRAIAQVQLEQPAVFNILGTAGMLCCRYVRGSNTAISNHSWGTAIDFTLNGILDRRGDNQVQIGLTLIAPIMNQHGWYWGAAFRTEDAMHFEASQSLISQWATQIR